MLKINYKPPTFPAHITRNNPANSFDRNLCSEVIKTKINTQSQSRKIDRFFQKLIKLTVKLWYHFNHRHHHHNHHNHHHYHSNFHHYSSGLHFIPIVWYAWCVYVIIAVCFDTRSSPLSRAGWYKEYVYHGFIFCDIIHVFFIYLLLNFRLYDSLKLKSNNFRKKITKTKNCFGVWSFP